MWYVGTISPASSVQSPQEGDCYLNVTTGNVEYYERAMWVYKGNIAGPAGANGSPGLTPYIQSGYWYIGNNNTGVRAEGRDGATGTPGPAIDIVANLASIDLLPTPTEDIRHRGYLITSGTENRLYFVAGVDELYWDYIVFDGNGTVVTVDGVGQTSWETNTKLDKSNSTNTLYGVASDGTQGNFSFSIVPKYGAMARFGDGGRLRTNEPITELECANKAYVDDTAATKADKINTPYAVYATDSSGNPTYYEYAYGPKSSAIPLYSARLTLRTSTPQQDDDCANKAYVDAALPQYKTEVLKLTSPGNTPYVLSIDQLTNRVGGTPVHITYIQGAHLAAPSNEIALGNTSIVESNDWEGIPYLNNNNTFQSFTVNISHTGDLFYINKRNESGTIAANSITFGMTHSATTDNQTIIIQYTST